MKTTNKKGKETSRPSNQESESESESDVEEETNGGKSSDEDGETEEYHANPSKSLSNVPLYKRLAEQNSEESVSIVARERVKKRRLQESARGTAELPSNSIDVTSSHLYDLSIIVCIW